jgi:TetR/AcrR family transcriptional repressor of nem operon
MARPRKIERGVALRAAMAVFWTKGFAGTSMVDLVEATGLAKQSLYHSFGDKMSLYVEALSLYCNDQYNNDLAALTTQVSPLDRVEWWLIQRISNDGDVRKRGCMAANAVVEFGESNLQVSAVITSSREKLHRLLVECANESKRASTSWGNLDSDGAATFFETVASGMQVMARSGADLEFLRRAARRAPVAARRG